MPEIISSDGTKIHYLDWGSGQPVVFSHGWPLNGSAWSEHMFHLASHGYRCIAHDRRAHGFSTNTWNGNDMDHYADDLSALTEALNLDRAIHVGHSTGGGEVARYVARHGSKRVAAVVLVGAVTPVMLQSSSNPNGVPLKVFDELRANLLADRAQLFQEFTTPFYGRNRTGSNVSQGVCDTFWLQGMQAGLKGLYDCIAAFSQTDQTADLKQIDVPTLIIHGDDDQVVPIDITARIAAKLIQGSTLKVYPGAPHGLTVTNKDQLCADILAFIKELH